MINISNYVSKDNTTWLLVQPARTAAATGTPARTAASGRSPGGRAYRIMVVVGRMLLGWLAAIPRRLGDRLFATNDIEAYWRDWQITRTHGGLGRRYRDPRFGALAGGLECGDTGGTADPSCLPSLGTGRITRGEVS